MTTSNAGAVFFLGTRAHYQVLQQPETRSYDTDNGNESTETIYPNPDQEPSNDISKLEYTGNNWNCDLSEVIVNDKDGNVEIGTGVKRRSKRCASEITLCDRDDLKPAQLNNLSSTATSKPRVWRARTSLAALLAKLARKKNDPPSFQLHSALTECSYREACRCLDCQSRYFECDESEGYSSDDSEYSRYLQEYQQNEMAANEANYANGNIEDEYEDEDDDEVFIDTVPGDNTSTDLLIDKPPPKETTSRYVDKMSISSDDIDEASLQLEVAAGTPALLNYLLTHPVTCVLQ